MPYQLEVTINTKFFAAVAFILVLTPLTYAHPGGHGPKSPYQDQTQPEVKTLDDKGAIKAASDFVATLVRQGTKVDSVALDSSWVKTAAADKKINKRGSGYFIVSFNNKTADKVLFTLISDTGEFYDVNFSGKFLDLME